jgi:hypothetical protein
VNLRRLIEVCTILDSYKAPGDHSGDVCAEHDEIYLNGPAPEDMSAEHRSVLKDLGADYDERVGSWQVFT